MSKTKEQTDKLIAETKIEIEKLREEYDSASANHAHRQVQISQQISSLIAFVERLERFKAEVL